MTGFFYVKNILLIFLLNLLLVSCLGPEIGSCPRFDQTLYEPDPTEEFEFMAFHYMFGYERYMKKKSYMGHLKEFFFEEEETIYWKSKEFVFNWEKYCYKPPELLTSKKQESSKKKYGFDFLKNSLQFVSIKSLFFIPCAKALSCRAPYYWYYPKKEMVLSDKNQKYFFLFKIYNESDQVIFEKKQYAKETEFPRSRLEKSYSYSSIIFLPYFSKARSIKVFLVESSIEEQIGEIPIASFEKIKKFSNYGTKNCYINYERIKDRPLDNVTNYTISL